MQLKKLILENFRNWSELEFSPSSGINILHGLNAEGKTNILEAIYLLSISKSFRTRESSELISWSTDYTRVIGETQENKYEVALVRDGQIKKKAHINGVVKNLNEFVGEFPAVLFHPDNLEIITHSPSDRRRYFDIFFSICDQSYFRELLQYNHSLKSRNKLLGDIRDGYSQRDELVFWDSQLIESAEKIITTRQKIINEIKNIIQKKYQKLSGLDHQFEIKYLASADSGTDLAERLQKNLNKDIRYASTSIGPHRDDYDFLLDQHRLAQVGSRGEFRTALLSLKFAELETIEKYRKQKPIFLLDDIFSEFDPERRRHILEEIKGLQTILTTTDIDQSDQTIQDIKIWRIADKKVVQE